MLNRGELLRIKKEAVRVAESAGEILMRYYRKKLAITEKEKAGLVTQADVKSERFIQKSLNMKFPGFAFLGEESGESNKGNADTPVWHVDPLDGTTNFVHGFPMFCVSIGLAVLGEPVLGVVHIPTIKETYHGALGCGAFFNKKKIRVSPREKLSECLLTTGFAYTHGAGALNPEIEHFKQAHLEARAVRRPGAAAIDLAYVAAGIFDGFWEKNLSSWDVCAGTALIREAGGKVTNYAGLPFDLFGKEVLATNGRIHARMMEMLSV